MPQFDFILIHSVFFISFFYFISFFFFFYNKLPVLSFFIKYLDKILYYSYLNIIKLDDKFIPFPICLFNFLSILKISHFLTISFFRNKRFILLDIDFQLFI